MPTRSIVLIADGTPSTIPDVTDGLAALGAEVVSAADAAFVQTLAVRHRPSAIVLGAKLPAGGSLVALRRVRGSAHTAAIPVIAVSPPGAAKQALLSAGVDACLEPPVGADDLLQAIRTRLEEPHPVTNAPAEILADPARLAAVQASGLADGIPDESLDLVTRLATRVLGVPVALVSLVDDKRQIFKSQVGVAPPFTGGTGLSHSFCQWVVSSEEELIVNDARVHDVLRRNPAIADIGVVAYAGIPIAAATGEAIGSFCAIDQKPHAWDEDERASLRDLAQIVEGQAVLNASAGPSGGVTRAAAKSMLGAARLLRRGRPPLTAEDRDELARVIERQTQQLLTLYAVNG